MNRYGSQAARVLYAKVDSTSTLQHKTFLGISRSIRSSFEPWRLHAVLLAESQVLCFSYDSETLRRILVTLAVKGTISDARIGTHRRLEVVDHSCSLTIDRFSASDVACFE